MNEQVKITDEQRDLLNDLCKWLEREVCDGLQAEFHTLQVKSVVWWKRKKDHTLVKAVTKVYLEAAGRTPEICHSKVRLDDALLFESDPVRMKNVVVTNLWATVKSATTKRIKELAAKQTEVTSR